MAKRNDTDDTRRVELTPRQIRDMERLIGTVRAEKSTDRERDDAAGMLVGYLGSALSRKS